MIGSEIRRVLALCSAMVGVATAPVNAVADALAEHRAAALEFYQEARLNDAQSVARVVADMLVQLQPGLARHRGILEEYAAEVVESERYTLARVEVYMALFTEEELRTLTWLFRHATFRRYREQRIELVKRNTAATLNMFGSSLSELERRIRGSGGEEDGER